MWWMICGGGMRTPSTSEAAASVTPVRAVSRPSGRSRWWPIPDGIVRDPDPKSRTGAVRVIGYSPSAGFVITVVATRSDHAGATAWKTSGADLRAYEGQGKS